MARRPGATQASTATPVIVSANAVPYLARYSRQVESECQRSLDYGYTPGLRSGVYPGDRASKWTPYDGQPPRTDRRRPAARRSASGVCSHQRLFVILWLGVVCSSIKRINDGNWQWHHDSCGARYGANQTWRSNDGVPASGSNPRSQAGNSWL